MRPANRAELPELRAGDAFLAGGTWLFSEPQPDLRRLVDLAALDWPPLTRHPEGLEIAATCRLADLDGFSAAPDCPAEWRAATLFSQCCHALWGSFKIHNAATVGGNLCMALPAGPMAALLTALDGVCLIWTREGGERRLAVADFIVDAGRNALLPGEVLRSIWLPRAALLRITAFQQASLTRFGRSAALLIGTRDPGRPGLRLTITASVRAPIRLAFEAPPSAEALAAAMAASLPDAVLHDDVHGAPGWKRHMSVRAAEAIRQELCA